MWQGLGDMINEFRRFELGLNTLSDVSGSTLIDRLQVPFTYLWYIPHIIARYMKHLYGM